MQLRAASISTRWAYSLLLLLAFVLYGNTLRNDYALDDGFVVKDNPYVQMGLKGLPQIGDKPFATLKRSTLDYRPISPATFAIEHEFFNDNPHISHFFNLLLYACCLIVVYRMLVKIFKLDEVHGLLPLFITVLFVVHPIHTEVVCSLKNRDELLIFLFGLLFVWHGVKYYTREKRRWISLLVAIIFFGLSCMSKITGVIFFPILFAICWYKGYFSKKTNLIFMAILMFVVYRAVDRAFRDFHRTTNLLENPLQTNKALLISIGTSLKILLYHIKMLLLPYPLLYYYGSNYFTLNGLGNPLAIFSLVLHAALFIYGFYLFLKKDMLGLLIVLYFISIALYANFPIAYTGMFAERTLFMSSLWFIAACLLVAFRFTKKYIGANNFLPNGFVIPVAIIALIYSVLTIQRNFLWKDNITLMSHDIKWLNNSILGNYIYANNLKAASDAAPDSATARAYAEQAVPHYERSIELVSNYPEFFLQLANLYQYNLHDFSKAEETYKKALQIDSFYATAHLELGRLYLRQQNFREAYRYLGNAYSINPTDSLSQYYFAQVASAAGDLSTAYRVNHEFVQQHPDMPVAYVNLGVTYSKMLKDDSAIIYFVKAVDLGYRENQLLTQMAIYYKAKNNPEKEKYYLGLRQ